MNVPSVLRSGHFYAAGGATAALGVGAALAVTSGPDREYYMERIGSGKSGSHTMHRLPGGEDPDRIIPRMGGEFFTLGAVLTGMFGVVGASTAGVLLRDASTARGVARSNVAFGIAAGIAAAAAGAIALSGRNDHEVPMPTRGELIERVGPADPVRHKTVTDVDGNEVKIPIGEFPGRVNIDGKSWPHAEG